METRLEETILQEEKRKPNSQNESSRKRKTYSLPRLRNTLRQSLMIPSKVKILNSVKFQYAFPFTAGLFKPLQAEISPLLKWLIPIWFRIDSSDEYTIFLEFLTVLCFNDTPLEIAFETLTFIGSLLNIFPIYHKWFSFSRGGCYKARPLQMFARPLFTWLFPSGLLAKL